jgi:regulator of RNase E activity RraA
MSQIETISAEELALLQAVDTPTICNAIELFDVRPRNTGYMDQRIQANFPEMPPMVGYATTATYRSYAPPRSGDVYTGIVEQVDQFDRIPAPRVVVFQDLDNPSAAATFGEVMCTTYKNFGCAGLITSGTGRDLDQVRAIDFPVFTSGTICAHGYCHIIDINVPVHVGGITVYPGDLIHGDCNGVTTIPNKIAGQVGRSCQGFIEAESFILDFLGSGSQDKAAWAESRKAYSNKVAELKQQITDGADQ